MMLFSHFYIMKLFRLSFKKLVYDNTDRFDYLLILFLLYKYFQVLSNCCFSLWKTSNLGITKIYVRIQLLLKYMGIVKTTTFCDKMLTPARLC